MLILLFRLLLALSVIAGMTFGCYYFRYTILIEYLNFRLNKTPIEIIDLSINSNRTSYPSIFIDTALIHYDVNEQALFELTLRNTQVNLSGLPHQNPVIRSLISDSAEIHGAGFASLSPTSLTDLSKALVALKEHSQLTKIEMKNTTLMIDEPFPKNIAGHILWDKEKITIDFNNTTQAADQNTTPATFIYSATIDNQENLTGSFQLSNSKLKIKTSAGNTTKNQSQAPQTDIEFDLLGEDLTTYRISTVFSKKDRLTGTASFKGNTQSLSKLLKESLTKDTWHPHLINAKLTIEIDRLDKFLGQLKFNSGQLNTVSVIGDFNIEPIIPNTHDKPHWRIKSGSQSQVITQGELVVDKTTQPFSANISIPPGWQLFYSDPSDFKVLGSNTQRLNNQRLDSQKPNKNAAQIKTTTENAQLIASFNRLNLTRAGKTTITSNLTLEGTIHDQQLVRSHVNLKTEEKGRGIETKAEGRFNLPNITAPISFTASSSYEKSKQQGLLEVVFQSKQGLQFVQTLKTHKNIWKPKTLEQYLFQMNPEPAPLTLEGKLPWQYWPPAFSSEETIYKHQFKTAPDN